MAAMLAGMAVAAAAAATAAAKVPELSNTVLAYRSIDHS